MNPQKAVSLRFRIAPEQKVKLDEIAADRKVPTSVVVRDLISAATGVSDPLPKPRRGGGIHTNHRGPKRKGRKNLTT